MRRSSTWPQRVTEGKTVEKQRQGTALTFERHSHYGPGFYRHFRDQNEAIRNGTNAGVALNFNTLSIGNGIIDEAIQGMRVADVISYFLPKY